MFNQEEKDPRWFFELIRRELWIVIACMAIAIVVAIIVTQFVLPAYEATATLLIEPSQDFNPSDYSSINAGEQLALTYSQMLVGKPVLLAVIQQLNLDETPDKLEKRITVKPINGTQLIRLTASDSLPEKAATLANTLAEVFSTHVRQIEADRYGKSLESMKEKVDASSKLLDENQSKIDKLTAQSIEKEAEIANLGTVLIGYREDYRAIQQSYQALQLTSSQLTNKVHIVEPAQVRDGTNSSAVVLMLVDPTLVVGEGTYTTETRSERVALVYGQVLKGKTVLEAVKSKLKLTKNTDEIAQSLSVESIPDSMLIQLRVTDPDTDYAVTLADAVAETFVNQIQMQLAKPYVDSMDGLQQQMDSLSSKIEQSQTRLTETTIKKSEADTEVVRLKTLQVQYTGDDQLLRRDYEQLRLTATRASNAVVIAEPASIPEKPSRHWLIILILAGMIGLVAGLGAALLMDQLDETVRSRYDIAYRLGLKHLGKIGTLKEENELVVFSQTDSQISEDFRSLSINLRLSNLGTALQTLLITSPGISDGKSVVTANLAVTMARLGLRVIAVDADFRSPSLHRLFGLDQEGGLTAALLHGEVAGTLRSTREEKLKVLTSGELPVNPAEVLSSPQMRKVLDELSEQADLILIDCPPILLLADSKILASVTDGVLLVLRAGVTTTHSVREAVDGLKQIGANLVGAVLNAATTDEEEYYPRTDTSFKARVLNRYRLLAVRVWALAKDKWSSVVNRLLYNRRQP